MAAIFATLEEEVFIHREKLTVRLGARETNSWDTSLAVPQVNNHHEDRGLMEMESDGVSWS